MSLIGSIPGTKKNKKKKEKKEFESSLKKGKTYTKAQLAAKKRIAAKKAGTYKKPKTAQELAKERIGKGTAKNPDTSIKDIKKKNKLKVKKEKPLTKFQKRRKARTGRY